VPASAGTRCAWALARRAGQGPWDEFIAVDLGERGLDAGLLEGIEPVFHLAIQKPGVVLRAIVKPVIFGFKADQYRGRFSVTGIITSFFGPNANVLGEKVQRIILDARIPVARQRKSVQIRSITFVLHG